MHRYQNSRQFGHIHHLPKHSLRKSLGKSRARIPDASLAIATQTGDTLPRLCIFISKLFYLRTHVHICTSEHYRGLRAYARCLRSETFTFYSRHFAYAAYSAALLPSLLPHLRLRVSHTSGSPSFSSFVARISAGCAFSRNPVYPSRHACACRVRVYTYRYIQRVFLPQWRQRCQARAGNFEKPRSRERKES